MYCKAKHFGDEYHADLILETTNPAEAKRYGRKVRGFDVTEWTKVLYNYMLQVNLSKYEQNDTLKDILFNTNNKHLVECNKNDTIWAVGLYADDDCVLDQSQWRVKNLLGQVLMEVRNKLKG